MNDTKKIRGRPRKLNPEQAAAVAMELFWRKGYDAVGIAELTEALGIKSPSLYAAFGNKANIFAAALKAYDGLVAPRFAPAFAEQTATGFTKQILEIAAELYTSNAELPGCLVLDGARNSVDHDAKSHAATHQSVFTLAMQQKLADLKAEDPSQMADDITIAMLGLSGAARIGLKSSSIKQSAKNLAQALNGPRSL